MNPETGVTTLWGYFNHCSENHYDSAYSIFQCRMKMIPILLSCRETKLNFNDYSKCVLTGAAYFVKLLHLCNLCLHTAKLLG